MNTQVNFAEVKTAILSNLFNLNSSHFNMNGVTVDVDNRLMDIQCSADVTAKDSANNELTLSVNATYIPFDLESNDGLINFTILADDVNAENAEVSAIVDEVNIYFNEQMEAIESTLLKQAKALAVKNATMYRVGLVKKMATQGIIVA